MSQIKQILAKLDESERVELGSFVHMLYDPISRNILAWLTINPQTSLCSNDLPLAKLDANNVADVMFRLYRLQKLDLVKTSSKQISDKHYSIYNITDYGKEITQQYMKKEMEHYS